MAAGLALLALALGTAGAPSTSGHSHHALGSAATYALLPGYQYDYVLPITPPADYTLVNYGIHDMMYRPLYWFGVGTSPVVNYKLSLANPPVTTNGGRTVTITLKHYLWSDGTPIIARDVQLWLNLVAADKSNYGPYVPGDFPDNVTRASYPSPSKIVITFNHAYNPHWLLYNELSQFYPLPQQSWDRRAAAGPVGNFDLTPAGARHVFTFLTSESSTLATYSTNPLWKVVDGPWRLTSYSPTTGYTTMAPNHSYSGSPKPTIGKLELVPFTNDTAEMDALRSGALDYGYLPYEDLSTLPYFTSHGFRFAPWQQWSFNYLDLNFTNPSTGRFFDQLYIRQAMQNLVDQPQFIARVWHGYASPTYGPTPLIPRTSLADAYESHNPYPFDAQLARGRLGARGWRVVKNGLTTCVRPGTGPAECGAHIDAGAGLSFTLMYFTGNIALAEQMQALKSDFALAGIQLVLRQLPENTVIADTSPCKAHGSGCSWDMSTGFYIWTYTPDTYPTGGQMFASGAASNLGGYSNRQVDALIKATHVQPGLASYYRYENALAKTLPVLWIPVPDYQLSLISTKLQGATPQNPLSYLTPESWRIGR